MRFFGFRRRGFLFFYILDRYTNEHYIRAGHSALPLRRTRLDLDPNTQAGSSLPNRPEIFLPFK